MLSDYGKETENLDKEEKTEIDTLSETCSSSISQQVENVDEDVLEFREEDVKKVRQLLDVMSEYILCFYMNGDSYFMVLGNVQPSACIVFSSRISTKFFTKVD